MGRRKFQLSVLRKNYERSKYAAPKSLPVSIRLSQLQSTAGPLTTNTKCSSLEELRGVLKGATNAIPVGWSMIEDDDQFGARLIVVKVSAQETAGAKIAYSLTVHSNFTYTVHAQENLLEVSRTTLLQHLPTSVSTLSSMTTIMKAIDSSVICRGNPNKKYHSLRGWTKGSFLDRTGELLKLYC